MTAAWLNFSAKRRGTRAMGSVELEIPSRSAGGRGGDRAHRYLRIGSCHGGGRGGCQGCAAATCRAGRRAVMLFATGRRMIDSGLGRRTKRDSSKICNGANGAADGKQDRLR